MSWAANNKMTVNLLSAPDSGVPFSVDHFISHDILRTELSDVKRVSLVSSKEY